ncbi:MAG: hypothetical protein AABO57_11075 [Acidobacteriota bacterium]
MKRVVYLLIALLFSPSVLATGASPVQLEITESYSFENDFEGWSVNATDVWGAPPLAWSVTRSQDQAKKGSTSVEFFLANSNGAEKIWIEKAFAVEPNQIYHVDVEYALASNEPSTDVASSFTVITGVLAKSPRTRVDLGPAFKDSTRKPDSESGYGWFRKTYEFAVRSDEQGMLHVVIGIWGDWEVRKTYYIDDVHISLTKKPQGTEFFSFENDMEGWMPNATDLDFGSSSIDWSIARIQPFALGAEDGASAVEFDINNVNQKGKIWIERPFLVERGSKYKVTVEYGFNSGDRGSNPRFTIITGVLRRRPETADDLVPAYQEETTSGYWGWLHKNYTFKVKSKKSDVLYVVIGIRGTEVVKQQNPHRRYHIDSVCVTLTKISK